MYLFFIITAKKIFKIAYKVAIALVVLFLIYFFHSQKLDILGYTIQDPVFSYTHKLKLWIYIIIVVLSISVVATLIILILSFLFNLKNILRRKHTKRLEQVFTKRLCNFLLSANSLNQEKYLELVKLMKPITKSYFQVEIFFGTYIKIQEILTIDLSKRFTTLFYDLKLENKLKAFLYNDKLEDKILAMKILSMLSISTYNRRILKYANGNNMALRLESYNALIKLLERDSLSFDLIEKSHKLSLLDINVIVNSMIEHQREAKYEKVLSSEQPWQRIYGLLMAKHKFDKKVIHINPGIVELVFRQIDYPNTLINKLAWDTYLAIIPESQKTDLILGRFVSEPEEIQLIILKHAQDINDIRFFDFLEQIIEQVPLLVKIEAIRILLDNDPTRLEKFDGVKDKETVLAFEEVSDIYIN